MKYFLSKAENTHIDDLTSQRVVNYLNSLNKNKFLQDWQINQAVDAIRFFLHDILKKEFVTEIDWQSYHHAVSYQPKHHMAQIEELDIPELISQKVEKFDKNLRLQYGDLLTRIVRVLRVRNYSKRTEHTYLMWITRFLLFFNSKKIKDKVFSHHVREYLEYLAFEGRCRRILKSRL